MRDGARTYKRTRRIGTMAAGGLAVLFGGVVGWFIYSGSGEAGPDPLAGVRAPDEPPRGTTLDLSEEFLGSQGAGVVSVWDKRNPERKSAEIIYGTLDPLPNRRYLVARPEAWVFLRDGGSVHVSADVGRFYIPDRTNPPESGTLEGAVVVRVFEPTGGGRPDLERDEPSATIRTERADFDMTLGELTAPGRIVVWSREVEFAGSGANLRFNEVRQRLEASTIREGEYLRYTRRQGAGNGQLAMGNGEGAVGNGQGAVGNGQWAMGNGEGAMGDGEGARGNGQLAMGNGEGGAPARAGEAIAPEPPEPPAPETLYRVMFSENVLLRQEGREVRSEALDVWARLVNNRLPEGAVARIETAGAEGNGQWAMGNGQGEVGDGQGEGNGQWAMGNGQGEVGEGQGAVGNGQWAMGNGRGAVGRGDGAATRAGDEIELTWTGPLMIVPLERTPRELEGDHVSLRFATEGGAVEISDGETGATGRCAVLEYGATSRQLVLGGSEREGVVLDSAREGTLRAARAEADLGNGVVYLAGPVSLEPAVETGEGEEGGGAAARRITCRDHADVVFRMEEGRLTSAIQEAIFSGDVEAVDGDGRFRGDLAHAYFAGGAGRSASLSRLVLVGERAVAGRGEEWIEARVLDSLFAQGSREGAMRPREVLAQGEVLVKREDGVLESDWLLAELGPDERGRTGVVEATARGRVRYAGTDGIAARCDELRARGPDWVVDMTGEVELADGEQSAIRGTQMRLEAGARRLMVFGAGDLEHREEARGEGEGRRLAANWTEQMIFDDRAGVAVVRGDAISVARREEGVRDSSHADEIRVEFTPYSEGAEGEDGGRRRVLRAIATGSILEEEGGRNARVRTEARAGGGAWEEGELAQLAYMEGARIIADDEAGTLEVPGAGRLLIVENRDRSAEAPGGADGAGLGAPGGASLFTWGGEMRMRREAGLIEMVSGVRLRRRASEQSERTDLDCERMTARVRRIGGEEDRYELVSATAQGAVWLASGARELIADLVEYDAVARTLEAIAEPGNIVSMFDAARGAPVSARSIFWNLETDQISVREPGPVVAPR